MLEESTKQYSLLNINVKSLCIVKINVGLFSVRWIRLLHHCLTAYKEVEESVASAAAQIPNLMNTCSALLVSPISNVYVPNIEEVLLRLGLHSVDMGLALVDNILRSPSNRANSGWKHYF